MKPFRLVLLSSLPFALATGAAACGTSSSSHGNAERASTTGATSSALLGAPADTGHSFAVGVCESALNTDPDAGVVGACLKPGSRCTGTLVAPNLVLTAQHCVAGNPVYGDSAVGFCDATFAAPKPLAQLNVTLSDSVLSGPPAWRTVQEVIVPPAQSPHTPTESCDTDIALLVLTNDVAASDATPVDVDVDTDVATHPPSAVTVVGRGVVAAKLELDANSPDYMTESDDAGGLTRRILQNIPFFCASNTALSDGGTSCVVVDYSSPPTNLFSLPPSNMAYGFGTASGDSGSGVLDQTSFASGHPKVIAVNSAGTYGADGVPNYGLGVRTSIHKSWLLSSAQHAATVGGYPLPVWAGGTPPADGGKSDGGGHVGDASSGFDGSVVGGDDAGRVADDDAGDDTGGSGDSSGCSMVARAASEQASWLGLVGVALGFGATRRRRRRR